MGEQNFYNVIYAYKYTRPLIHVMPIEWNYQLNTHYWDNWWGGMPDVERFNALHGYPKPRNPASMFGQD